MRRYFLLFPLLTLCMVFPAGCVHSSTQEPPPVLTPSPPQPVSPTPPTTPSQAPEPVVSFQDDPVALTAQADALLRTGNLDRAAALLWHIVGAFPDHAPAWELLSMAYSRLELYTAAAAAGERAAAIKPSSVTAHVNTASALARTGELDQARAIAHLLVAQQLNPEAADSSYLLGSLYERINQPEKAIAVYEQALQHFPSDNDLQRALVALKGKLTSDAIQPRVSMDANTVIVKDPSSGTELLRWEEVGKEQGAAVARILDLGGRAPVLVVTAQNSASIFIWTHGKLVQVGRVQGHPDYNPIERSLDVSIQLNQSARKMRYRVQGDHLITVKEWEEQFKPVFPVPTTSLELLTAVTEHFPSAMADQALWKEIAMRMGSVPPGSSSFAYLLPEPGARFRLEVYTNGAKKGTAQATVSGDGGFQVKRLDWQP
jgi:tetratricopeptide (TPR) repeat protein